MGVSNMYSLTSARYLSIFLTCENATLGFLLGQSAAASLCGRHEEHVTKLFFLEKLCPTLNFQEKKDAQDIVQTVYEFHSYHGYPCCRNAKRKVSPRFSFDTRAQGAVMLMLVPTKNNILR